ncbi:hypothetical protein A1Q2_03833 [Trichosporon asahii var. asahii CBS 8904]|uniref:Uncharacterized protein n=1 Tax=Trichosporon asahii var. asahii (strain CBS 8904) TaxID=1220162 RepID=K1VCS8_TRIAC|nr:hypothetical protein A1Q2_03833 [Trichosporon asahii var. asahii CBS 8904]
MNNKYVMRRVICYALRQQRLLLSLLLLFSYTHCLAESPQRPDRARLHAPRDGAAHLVHGNLGADRAARRRAVPILSLGRFGHPHGLGLDRPLQAKNWSQAQGAASRLWTVEDERSAVIGAGGAVCLGGVHCTVLLTYGVSRLMCPLHSHASSARSTIAALSPSFFYSTRHRSFTSTHISVHVCADRGNDKQHKEGKVLPGVGERRVVLLVLLRVELDGRVVRALENLLVDRVDRLHLDIAFVVRLGAADVAVVQCGDVRNAGFRQDPVAAGVAVGRSCVLRVPEEDRVGRTGHGQFAGR